MADDADSHNEKRGRRKPHRKKTFPSYPIRDLTIPGAKFAAAVQCMADTLVVLLVVKMTASRVFE